MSAYETQNYSLKLTSVEGDRLNHAKLAPESSGLHSEAIKHLAGPNAKHASGRSNDGHSSAGDSGKFMPTNGDYWVVRGDNLYKIAQRSLLAQGNEHPDGRSVFKEIDRIVELNLKYYPKLKDHRLEPGMILTVEDKTQSAKPGTEVRQTDAGNKGKAPNDKDGIEGKGKANNGVCTDQTWKFAEPGTVTTAQNCDLVFAGADSKVVVHPGGQAILQKGSSGFVFKGARATVMEGATVIDAGGAIEIQPGAKIISVDALSKQAQVQAQIQRDTQAQLERDAQAQVARDTQAQSTRSTQAQATRDAQGQVLRDSQGQAVTDSQGQGLSLIHI